MRWGVAASALFLASCAAGTAVVEPSPARPTSEAETSTDAVTSMSVADGSLSIPELETADSASEEDYLERAPAENDASDGSDVSRSQSQDEVDGSAGGDSPRQGTEVAKTESADESSTSTDPKVAGGTGGLSDSLIYAIAADAAHRLGVEVSAVTVVSVESKAFNDSSLGCPKLGTSYTQVVTPGHVVLVEGAGVALDYRVDGLHGTFEVCE